VLNQGQTSISILDVPNEGSFVEFNTGKVVARGDSYPAPLGKTPVFYRVGSIVPKQMRLRRSSELMYDDPFTLFAVIDAKTGTAKGRLYLDDTISFAHASRGEKIVVEFNVSGCGEQQDGLSCTMTGSVFSSSSFKRTNKIERVILVGVSSKKMNCGMEKGKAVQGSSDSWKFDVECGGENKQHIVWRKPWVDVNTNFVLSFRNPLSPPMAAKDRVTERQRKRVQTRWMIQLEKNGWEMTPEQFDEMYVGERDGKEVDGSDSEDEETK